MPKDFDPTSPLRRANFFADCLLLIHCQAEYLISLSDVFFDRIFMDAHHHNKRALKIPLLYDNLKVIWQKC